MLRVSRCRDKRRTERLRVRTRSNGASVTPSRFKPAELTYFDACAQKCTKESRPLFAGVQPPSAAMAAQAWHVDAAEELDAVEWVDVGADPDVAMVTVTGPDPKVR